jgi:serine protease Do
MDGKLLGINSAIYSKDGGSNGIGFAIPAAMVRSVVQGILATGKPVRPWLGASGEAVTGEIAASLGLPRPAGVLVSSVFTGSPAEQAGLKRGDVILGVNGREVMDAEALRFRIATLPLGEPANFRVLRQGREMAVTARLIAPPEVPPRDITEINGRNPFAGSTVANLSPALIEELGADLGAQTGVVILRLRRGSLAQQVQLRPADVVIKVNQHDIATVNDLKKAVERAPNGWRIQVKREGKPVTIQVGG